MTTRTTGPTVGEYEEHRADHDRRSMSGIGSAEQLMSLREVTGLPVVDRIKGLRGVLSQTDIVRAHASWAAAGQLGLAFAVRHLMTSPAVATHPR